MSSTVGNIMFMRWQFVITHMILHTEFCALLDSWVTNTPSVKMLCLQKYCWPYISKKRNMLRCWSVEDQLCFFCLLYSCVLVDYDTLLFHE